MTFEHYDGESKTTSARHQARAPPADAEAEMIRALVPILENVQDEKRVISALGDGSSQPSLVLVSAPNVVVFSRRPRCRHGRV